MKKFLYLLSIISCLGCSQKKDAPAPAITKSLTQNNVPATQPCGAAIGVECPGGNVQYRPNFYSSEGTVSYDNATSNGSGTYNGPDNPNGYILDVRVTYGGDLDEARQHTPYGYECIPLDLNRTTGGTVVFVCFTRNPSRVIQTKWDPNAGPVTGLRPFDDTSGGDNHPAIQSNENYLLAYACPFLSDCGWQVADLNRGTQHGPIACAVVRNSSARPIEIGIVYNQDAGINPPAGWTKTPYDLNKFVGGNCDVMYLCYKQK